MTSGWLLRSELLPHCEGMSASRNAAGLVGDSSRTSESDLWTCRSKCCTQQPDRRSAGASFELVASRSLRLCVSLIVDLSPSGPFFRISVFGFAPPPPCQSLQSVCLRLRLVPRRGLRAFCAETAHERARPMLNYRSFFDGTTYAGNSSMKARACMNKGESRTSVLGAAGGFAFCLLWGPLARPASAAASAQHSKSGNTPLNVCNSDPFSL